MSVTKSIAHLARLAGVRHDWSQDILDVLKDGPKSLNALTPEHLEAARELEHQGRIEKAGPGPDGRMRYRRKTASSHDWLDGGWCGNLHCSARRIRKNETGPWEYFIAKQKVPGEPPCPAMA